MDRSNEDSVSLNKFISNTGKCSRREAETFIKEGSVTINGNVAKLGNRVFPGDEVRLDGQKLKNKKRSIYIAFHKPVGIVCTTDPQEPDNIASYVNHKERLFPIGRLDKLSEGLIFMTNDGDIVNKILRAGNNHEKEYIVKVNKPITQAFIVRMGKGVPILGTVTKKSKVTQINETTFKIILTQGLNRQIRRMCEFLGYNVKGLKRTRIMNVRLDGIEKGMHRNLTQSEMDDINQMISSSSKTEEASVDFKKIKFKSKGRPSRSKTNKSPGKNKFSLRSKRNKR